MNNPTSGEISQPPNSSRKETAPSLNGPTSEIEELCANLFLQKKRSPQCAPLRVHSLDNHHHHDHKNKIADLESLTGLTVVGRGVPGSTTSPWAALSITLIGRRQLAATPSLDHDAMIMMPDLCQVDCNCLVFMIHASHLPPAPTAPAVRCAHARVPRTGTGTVELAPWLHLHCTARCSGSSGSSGKLIHFISASTV